MQSFRVIKPTAALVPYVRHYWVLSDDALAPVSERTLPVGCVQMVFHRGRQLFSLTEGRLQPSSFISGQAFGYSDVESTGMLEMIVVVFQPFAAKAFLHMPCTSWDGDYGISRLSLWKCLLFQQYLYQGRNDRV